MKDHAAEGPEDIPVCTSPLVRAVERSSQGGHHTSSVLWSGHPRVDTTPPACCSNLNLISLCLEHGVRGVFLKQAAGTSRENLPLVSGWSQGNSSTTLITLWFPPPPEEIRPWGQGLPAMAQISEVTERQRLSPIYFGCGPKWPGAVLVLLSLVVK